MSKEYIKLNAGDPDVEAPQFAINVALKAIIEGGMNTHYPHYTGYPEEFQKAVVEYYKRFTGVEYKPENVLPAAGSSAALYLALASVLKEGDEVMLFSPYYMGHTRIFEGMGVKANLVPLKAENKYHPELDDIAKTVTPKTKAVLVCNPANPTGTVFNEAECKAIGDVAVDNDMAIFADEIYLHFVYDDNKFVSIAGLHDDYKERTLGIMSFSKTFSMTGWRLGYDIVPERYLEKANIIKGLTAPRPATFVFKMGTACLQSDFKYVEERCEEYQKRRDYFTKAVNDLGWPCHKFEGAFYAWFDATSTGLSSKEFIDKLLKEQNVSMSPGDRFGADGFIRVPLVHPVSVLEDVVERLKAFKANL
ncbi:MAG: pyridoxal phosphate-dependent aminotransferase [Candidatus Bathyarchaeota archaeon]|nr:pyridoxal phosphate-dependent aminotransferase [Candidatus Bathyarchaeota archaeon]